MHNRLSDFGDNNFHRVESPEAGGKNILQLITIFARYRFGDFAQIRRRIFVGASCSS